MSNIYTNYLWTIKHYTNVCIIINLLALMVEFLELRSWANNICVPLSQAILPTAAPTIVAIFVLFSFHILFSSPSSAVRHCRCVKSTEQEAKIVSPPVSERESEIKLGFNSTCHCALPPLRILLFNTIYGKKCN